MTHSIYWPGTKIIRSTGNAFTAHERSATLIDWANTPGFATTVKQREQRAKALSKGRADTDAAYKRRGIDLAPKPMLVFQRAGVA